MNNLIQEIDYQKIIKSIPIFCLDFLISSNDKILLLKRNQEPLKGEYWVPGGRLYFKENIDKAAERILKREIGRSFNNKSIIGFANYQFQKLPKSRALHTPTLLLEISLKNQFDPILDDSHNNFVWSNKIPDRLIEENTIFEKTSIFKDYI